MASNTGIILLAAGSSSRLGQAKQLLPYQGKTLLQHAIETALASQAEKVLVVLGANAPDLLPQVKHPEVVLLHNPDWQEGMASSIRTGIRALQEVSPPLTQALIMLCDQPLVTPALLNEMLHVKKQTKQAIVACAYAETIGAPVLFDARMFIELARLKGQEGAKKILSRYPDQVSTVSFAAAALDIDTLPDYHALLQREKD